MWSGGSILVWKPMNKGSSIRLQLKEVNNLTENELQITLRHDPRGSKVRFLINDTPAKIDNEKTLDLYHPHRVFLRTHSLGKTALNKGPNYITVKFTGEPGTKKVGIDFIWLRK